MRTRTLDAVNGSSSAIVLPNEASGAIDAAAGVLRIRAICIAIKPAWFRIQAHFPVELRPGVTMSTACPYLDIRSDRRIAPHETLILEGPCPDVLGVRWIVPPGYRDNFNMLVFDWVGPDGTTHPQLLKPGRV